MWTNLYLNKLGIIKSRIETVPEVGFERNALHQFTFDHSEAQCLRSEVERWSRLGHAWREQSGIELFSNRVYSSGWVNLKTYMRMTGVTSYNNISVSVSWLRLLVGEFAIIASCVQANAKKELRAVNNSLYAGI